MRITCDFKAKPSHRVSAGFVSHLLRPAVSEAVTMTTPNAGAWPFLPASLRDDPILYPPPGSRIARRVVPGHTGACSTIAGPRLDGD